MKYEIAELSNEIQLVRLDFVRAELLSTCWHSFRCQTFVAE
jgi:hypothetical protein